MKKIEFSEKSHTYKKGDAIYTSVSRLIGKYKNKFNAPFWLRYKALEELIPDTFFAIRSLYTPPYPDHFLIEVTRVYLHDLGLPEKDLKDTEDKIKRSWKEKNEKSVVKGNKFHEEKEVESYFNEIELNPFTSEKYKVIPKNIILGSQNQSLVTDLYDLEDGYYPELLIWNDPYKLAGTADRVFIETKEDIRFIDIDDYKTNKAIKTENDFDQMKFPLDTLDDCNYNHYRLQGSLYAWMLSQFGFKIRNLAFTHTPDPSNIEDTTFYEYDYLFEEVEDLLTFEENFEHD